MKYERPGGGLVVFGSAAWMTMLGFRQMESSALEAGGVLLGRLILNSSDVVIDSITLPTVKDRRERFRFWRGKSSTQKLVDQAWHVSGSTRVYLGEWHSHPEEDPRPSSLDLSDQARIVRSAKYEHGFLFFAIVGTRRVRVWEAVASGQISPCRPIA
jgi:integrative and conjugative element protein (TIGR02256 family)